jgi:hypothetical protein
LTEAGDVAGAGEGVPSSVAEQGEAIKCLKYEVRKLKEAFEALEQAKEAAPVQEASVLSGTLVVPTESGKDGEKAPVSEEPVSEPSSSPSSSSVAPAEALSSLTEAVRCLKFEVRRLKEQAEQQAERAGAGAGPASEDQSEPAGASEGSTAVPASELKELKASLACVRYEVRRLKAAQSVEPKSEAEGASEPVLTRDVALTEAGDVAGAGEGAPSSVAEQGEAIKCLKYEVR